MRPIFGKIPLHPSSVPCVFKYKQARRIDYGWGPEKFSLTHFFSIAFYCAVKFNPRSISFLLKGTLTTLFSRFNWRFRYVCKASSGDYRGWGWGKSSFTRNVSEGMLTPCYQRGMWHYCLTLFHILTRSCQTKPFTCRCLTGWQGIIIWQVYKWPIMP